MIICDRTFSYLAGVFSAQRMTGCMWPAGTLSEKKLTKVVAPNKTCAESVFMKNKNKKKGLVVDRAVAGDRGRGQTQAMAVVELASNICLVASISDLTTGLRS